MMNRNLNTSIKHRETLSFKIDPYSGLFISCLCRTSCDHNFANSHLQRQKILCFYIFTQRVLQNRSGSDRLCQLAYILFYDINIVFLHFSYKGVSTYPEHFRCNCLIEVTILKCFSYEFYLIIFQIYFGIILFSCRRINGRKRLLQNSGN